MITTSLEKALQEFINSSRYRTLNIGSIKQFQLINEFERPYSVQGVFVLNGTKGSISVYVKIFKNWRAKPEKQFKEEIATEYHTIEFWYEQLKEFPEFTTFRPLYYSAKYNCIITENTPGENLAQLIQKKAKGFPKKQDLEQLKTYLFKSGQLLRSFQNKTQQDSIYSYSSLISDVDIRLKQLVKISHVSFNEGDRKEILNFFESHLSKFKENPVKQVVLHRDFGIGNILVNKNQIIVHDFNRLEQGHPLFDFTRLYHQLEMLTYKPIYGKKVIRELQSAYFSGYEFVGDQDDILFNLFLLRHYFTHLLGLVKTRESSLLSRTYSYWVKHRHLQNIRYIIRRKYEAM